MDNFRTALGLWLGRWHAQLVGHTPAMQEFCKRGLDKSVVFVPGRMIDAAEEMLNLWTRNDTNSAPTTPPKLPVVMVALGREMNPTGRDWTRDLADEQFISIDTDPKGRVFGLRVQSQDVRSQIVIAAHEADAARMIAAQFALWIQGYNNKRFSADWPFAGQSIAWPCQIESDDATASLIQTDAKNLTMLAIDVVFKFVQPYYRAPSLAAEFDGLGTTGEDGLNDPLDPHGFTLVQAVDVLHSQAPNDSTTWAGLQPITSMYITADGVTQRHTGSV